MATTNGVHAQLDYSTVPQCISSWMSAHSARPSQAVAQPPSGHRTWFLPHAGSGKRRLECGKISAASNSKTVVALIKLVSLTTTQLVIGKGTVWCAITAAVQGHTAGVPGILHLVPGIEPTQIKESKMSGGEWDDDDFEPAAPGIAATDPDGSMKAVQRKKKKPLAERIAEKEAARLAQLEEEKKASKGLTPDQKRAEAERLIKIQEQADLKLAKEAFGVDATGVDGMFPVTEEEFTKFRDALVQKITSFKSSDQYSSFIEKLSQDLVMDLTVDDLKKISTTTNSIFHEKQRQQKEVEKKKKKKSKTVVLERDTDFKDIAAAGRGDYDDSYYDDDFI
ncbi:EI3JA-like protein [Mya arenaria]|uniref:EI3JA-like protein n=1 Tax=Mya arenaria TaxID=6604 RepID=A0ABY7DWZ1_MYAAR|nr:EI3JA-like protein [Mya arenaria]